QEYKRKQLEEQRQSERLQRQLQQEHAYLKSLQQQQQQEKKPLYHYNRAVMNPSEKPAWAREVEERSRLNKQNSPLSITKLSSVESSGTPNQTPPSQRPLDLQEHKPLRTVTAQARVALKPSPRPNSLQDPPSAPMISRQPPSAMMPPSTRNQLARQTSDPSPEAAVIPSARPDKGPWVKMEPETPPPKVTGREGGGGAWRRRGALYRCDLTLSS
ncbi:hypothetical protein GDO81_026693, partial [Engystomops pustulosus]